MEDGEALSAGSECCSGSLLPLILMGPEDLRLNCDCSLGPGLTKLKDEVKDKGG